MTELSPRQSELARLVATGYTNREIAARLSIHRQTVKNHVSAIFKKLSVHNRVQLTLAIAMKLERNPFVEGSPLASITESSRDKEIRQDNGCGR